MYINGTELAVVLVLGLTALYAFAAIRIRELAHQAVIRESHRGEFQLLDQSVHLNRLSLSRDSKGRWRVWRQYRFDYTYDGVQRGQGFVIMLGRQLQSVVMPERDPVIH